MYIGNKIIITGLIVVTLVMGCILGFLYYTERSQTKGYEETSFTVQDVDIEETQADQRPRGVVNYTANVNYTYEYNGRFYNNDRVYSGLFEKKLKKGEAESVANNYSEGEIVDGYVNPDNPEKSYLIKDTGSGVFLFASIGILLFDVMAICLILFNDKFRNLYDFLK